MALVYKCTKIVVGGLPALGSNELGCQVYYVDPTTVPPTNYSSYRSILKTDCEDVTNLQTGLDAGVDTDHPGTGIDWDL